MKVWLYNDPVVDSDGEMIGNNLIEITDDQILESYWNHWRQLMELKYEPDHYLINPEQCINDWVIVNWAWEKKQS